MSRSLWCVVFAVIVAQCACGSSCTQVDVHVGEASPASYADAGAVVRRSGRSGPRMREALQLIAEGQANGSGSGSYVKKAGDSMSGKLHLRGTSGLVLHGTTSLQADADHTGIPIQLRQNGITRYASLGTLGSEAYGLYTDRLALSNASAATWLEVQGSVGTTVQAIAPTAGYGAIKYDSTNTRWRAYENGTWNALPSFNPDGGTPYGLEQLWTGTNVSSSNAASSSVSGTSLSLPIHGEVLEWVPQVAGSTAGSENVTISINSNTAGTLCTKTCACNQTINTSCAGACNVTVPAGTTYLVVDGTACTVSVPLGTLTLSYHPTL